MKRLRTQLSFIVLLAVAPALAFQAYTGLQAREIRRQLIADEALRLIRLLRSVEKQITASAEEVLDVIAGSPAVQDSEKDRCERLLTNLVRQSRRYNSAAVIGLDGRPRCFSDGGSADLDLSDRAYFRLALQTGRFAAGEYAIGRHSGKAGINFGKPFHDATGAIAGVVEVALDAEWLRQQLEAIDLPNGSTISIADRNGIIVARHPNGRQHVGHPIPSEAHVAFASDDIHVSDMQSLEGRAMVVGYVAAGSRPDGLFVGVGLDREITFAAVTRADLVGLMLIALGVLSALFVTVALGSRLIGRPVGRLLAAAELWRGGTLAARTGLHDDGSEFGRLGEAFDAMAAALADRERIADESQAALRRLTGELERRVADEVAAREAAQSRASRAERMQALGQLAGGVAHDFNNVLQAVAGAAALIEQRSDDGSNIRRLAHLVTEAAERGTSITHRLLAVGRRGDLRAEALDAAKLLRGLQEIFSHTLGAAIDVQVQLSGRPVTLLADKAQLETVLVNLASNARDAMPDGGRLLLGAVLATITDQEREPGYGAGPPLAPGRYVRLTVTDTGAGMDAATLARIGEPFFTTKPVGAGTGLGLPMAKGFAEQSGGACSIASSPGHGTAVTLWLPAADPGDCAPETPAQAATPRVGNHARILVVEDEELVREVLAEHLLEAGYAVLLAAHGADALALLADGETVDAIVTDLSMPGIDGLAVIRAAQELRPGLPAVLLTGYAGIGAATAVGGAVSGAFSMLRKPITGDALVNRLQALLDERKAALAKPVGVQ